MNRDLQSSTQTFKLEADVASSSFRRIKIEEEKEDVSVKVRDEAIPSRGKKVCFSQMEPTHTARVRTP